MTQKEVWVSEAGALEERLSGGGVQLWGGQLVVRQRGTIWVSALLGALRKCAPKSANDTRDEGEVQALFLLTKNSAGLWSIWVQMWPISADTAQIWPKWGQMPSCEVARTPVVLPGRSAPLVGTTIGALAATTATQARDGSTLATICVSSSSCVAPVGRRHRNARCSG